MKKLICARKLVSLRQIAEPVSQKSLRIIRLRGRAKSTLSSEKFELAPG